MTCRRILMPLRWSARCLRRTPRSACFPGRSPKERIPLAVRQIGPSFARIDGRRRGDRSGFRGRKLARLIGEWTDRGPDRKGETQMQTSRSLMTTEELAAALGDANLRIFDCTTYLEPLPPGSDSPYAAVLAGTPSRPATFRRRLSICRASFPTPRRNCAS